MQVNKQALERIQQSNITGPHLAETFKLLAAHPGSQMAGDSGATISFSLAYERPEDEAKEGDVFPVLTLSLKPPTENGKSDPTSDHPDSGAAPE